MYYDYPFVKFDAGKMLSRRPKNKDDCTVVAMAAVLCLPYDRAFEMMRMAGRKSSRKFDFTSWAEAEAKKIDGVFKYGKTFPAVKGEPRMTIKAFLQQCPTGVYVISTAKHVAAVINGVVYAQFQEHTNRCVYRCWRVK